MKIQTEETDYLFSRCRPIRVSITTRRRSVRPTELSTRQMCNTKLVRPILQRKLSLLELIFSSRPTALIASPLLRCGSSGTSCLRGHRNEHSDIQTGGRCLRTVFAMRHAPTRGTVIRPHGYRLHIRSISTCTLHNEAQAIPYRDALPACLCGNRRRHLYGPHVRFVLLGRMTMTARI